MRIRAIKERDLLKEKIIVGVDPRESTTELEGITHVAWAQTEVVRALQIIVEVMALTGKSTQKGTRDVTTVLDLGLPKETTTPQAATEKRIANSRKVSLIDTMKVGDAD